MSLVEKRVSLNNKINSNVKIKYPHVCPVCLGKGFVVAGFYNSTGNVYITSTTVPDKCRSCKGTGVVWHD